MPSNFSNTLKPPHDDDRKRTTLRWRSWPIVDHAPWSWLPLAVCAIVGGTVAYVSDSWLVGMVGAVGFAATLWQYFVPTHYEIGSQGLRRTALRRTRLVPWHSIQACQLRATGILLYQHPYSMRIGLLRSLFVPFPADEDEVLCVLREQLPHAFEFST